MKRNKRIANYPYIDSPGLGTLQREDFLLAPPDSIMPLLRMPLILMHWHFFPTSFIQESQKSLLALKSNLQSIINVQLILQIFAQEYTVAMSSSGHLLGCHLFSEKHKSNRKNYVWFIKTQNGPLRILLFLTLATHSHFWEEKDNLWEFFMFQDLSLSSSKVFMCLPSLS